MCPLELRLQLLTWVTMTQDQLQTAATLGLVDLAWYQTTNLVCKLAVYILLTAPTAISATCCFL